MVDGGGRGSEWVSIEGRMEGASVKDESSVLGKLEP
jgi:hypothetical protein